MRWIPFATKQRPINDFPLDREISHSESREIKSGARHYHHRCHYGYDDEHEVIIIFILFSKWVSFLSSELPNVSPVFPAVALPFWHFCQGAIWRARGQRVQQLTLDAGWPAGCRLPRAAATATAVPPWATPKATTDQLAERFTSAALDRPSEKLMTVNSQQTEAHWLVSWSHEFLGSPFNYSSKLLSAKAKPGERDREKAEMRRRGHWNTTKWELAFFTCARRLGHMCSFWIRIWITGEFD